MNHCIEKENLVEIMSKFKVAIVDVRSSEEYEAEHIEGALNIPLADIEKRMNELSTYELIITACGAGGGRSATASDILKDRGLHAKWLCKGTFGW